MEGFSLVRVSGAAAADAAEGFRLDVATAVVRACIACWPSSRVTKKVAGL